jgi:hypothetical protein
MGRPFFYFLSLPALGRGGHELQPELTVEGRAGLGWEVREGQVAQPGQAKPRGGYFTPAPSVSERARIPLTFPAAFGSWIETITKLRLPAELIVGLRLEVLEI